MIESPRSILFINWRDPRHPQAGGAERYLLDVGRRLVARGHAVAWLTAGFRGCAATETIEGIRVLRVGNAFTAYALVPFAYWFRFRATVDAIVDAENGVPFFAPLFARRPIVLLMFHVHQGVFERHLPFPVSTFFKWIEARVMPAIYARSAMVAISEDTRRDMTALLGIPASRVTLAYSGVDESLRRVTKSDVPAVVYVGRLKAYKHVDIVLRAFAIVRREVPDATLDIAGTGDREASLRDLAEELGIASVVAFHGFIDEERKALLLGRAWLVATASEMEGWGLTVIEAAACATPAIGFRVPGLSEAIDDGVTGLLVDCEGAIEAENSSAVAAFAAAMRHVLVDAGRRAEFSAAAYAHAATFSWDRTAGVFLERTAAFAGDGASRTA